MANSFLRLFGYCGRHCKRRYITTMFPAKETTIIGLNIANVLAVSITVDVEFYDGVTAPQSVGIL